VSQFESLLHSYRSVLGAIAYAALQHVGLHVGLCSEPGNMPTC
jgi:hypothetical protein